MSVRIGHASVSEKGTINGVKGDSTGKEVCVRTWYPKPWDFMAIHPDAQVREKHAQAVESACSNDNIGYGQNDRNTLNTLAKSVGYNLSKVGKCNCDCSALQNVAAVASGASGVSYGSNGWTTSTMKSALQKAGYKIITDRAYLTNEAYCVRGAIYVKAGSHTVCGLDNGSNYEKTLVKAGLGISITAKDVTTVAKEVIDGKWGNGTDRTNRLTAAGYNPTEVQAEVNRLLKGGTTTMVMKSIEEVAKEVINGKWGNGADRKKKLEAAGYNYAQVQAAVNKLCK